MKRITSVILTVLMLLTACSSRGNGDISSTVTDGIDTANVVGSTDTPSDTVSESTSPPEIPDTSELKSIGDNLWEIPLPSKFYESENQYAVFDILTRGDYLLAIYYDTSGDEKFSDKFLLLLFDIKTCKVVAEARVDRMTRISLLDDGYVSVIDDATLKTVIYDPKLNIEAEYPAIGSDMATSLAFVSLDRSRLVWSSDSARIMMKNLTTDKVTDLGYVVSDPIFCSEHEGIVYLFCFENDKAINYALDLGALTIKRLTEYDGMSPVGTMLPAFLHSEFSDAIMFPEDSGKIYLLKDMGESIGYPFDYRDGLFLSRSDSDGSSTVIALYSVKDSKKLSVNIPTGTDRYYTGTMRLADHGEIFIDATDDNRYPKLLLWMPESISQGESIGVTVTNRTGLLSHIDSLRKHIENQYGIKVHYGEDGSRFNAFDYVGEIVTDEIRIYNAITILNSTLSKYPNGIFSEMLDRELDSFEFYLCGKLSGIVAGTLDTALAITFTDYETRTKKIACDIGGYYMLDQTIAHELMHVMDDAILNAEIEAEIPYYSLWLGLLPEGVDYYYYYVDSSGFEPTDTSFTVIGEINEDDIYFIDTYSKTFPTEDRARIMEYLFKTENGVLSPSIRGEHLIEKCRVLCIILRKVFPSVASANGVFWENGLGEIDEGALDDLIARYNDYLNRYPAVG